MGTAAAPGAISLPNGGSISAVASVGSLTLFTHSRPDLAAQIQVPLDETVALDSTVMLAVVTEAPDSLLILEDSHGSRPGGLSFCKSGTEQFLRVLRLGASTTPEQTLQVKLRSCLNSIDLDEAGVIWDPSSRTITIHWLTGQAQYVIGDDGRATTMPSY